MGRRDFTVNAMARRLETGELIDPFGGVRDIARRELRTVSPTTFREDPLRLLRGLRLVSQLGFDLDGRHPRADARRTAEGLEHVSGERIGGGIAADGMGELSRLLLGKSPRGALRLARDTGVLVAFIPEYAAGDRVRARQRPAAGAARRASVPGRPECPRRRRVARRASRGAAPRPRQARDGRNGCRATRRPALGIAGDVLRRLRYPTRLRQRVVAIVREHAFHTEGPWPGSPRGGFSRVTATSSPSSSSTTSSPMSPPRMCARRSSSVPGRCVPHSRRSGGARTGSATSRWTVPT